MILDKLKEKHQKPLLCFEVNPPRGVNPESIFDRLDGNVTGIDFFNVTDSALARMKCSPLPFASILKQRYQIEPMVNISCRDRNSIALQSDLLSGWMMGIRSVVALTGDALSVGDNQNSKAVFELNSVGLLKIIETLNSGKDVAGNLLHGEPNYTPGVVVNPNAKNTAAEIKRLSKKKEAGALYALSQPVFEEESAEAFFKEASELNIPLFIGLLPFKSVKAAKNFSSIPGIKMSESLISHLEREEEKDLSDFSIDLSLKIAKKCNPYVRGVHVISGATPSLGLKLAKELSRWISTMGED